jgi:hypothetical protein
VQFRVPRITDEKSKVESRREDNEEAEYNLLQIHGDSFARGLASYGEAAAEDPSSAPGFVLSRPGSSLTPSFGALANWRTKALVRISQLRVVAGKRVAMHPRAVALAAWQEPGS